METELYLNFLTKSSIWSSSLLFSFKLSHEKQCHHYHLYYSALNCLTKSSVVIIIIVINNYYYFVIELQTISRKAYVLIIFITEFQTVSRKAVSSSWTLYWALMASLLLRFGLAGNCRFLNHPSTRVGALPIFPSTRICCPGSNSFCRPQVL
jgi:hypothetical protein